MNKQQIIIAKEKLHYVNIKAIKTILRIILFIFLIPSVIFFILGIIFVFMMQSHNINVFKIVPALIRPKSTYDHPYLNTEQEAILEAIGYDTNKLPTQLTEQQIQCASSILGEARVNEILSGTEPGIVEVADVKKCFE